MALTPARFEPCGLTTMYAMRYGALPLTRLVGGLADTVVDIPDRDRDAAEGTGFAFADPTAEALAACLRRAGARYRDPAAWQRFPRTAMRRECGWDLSARRYLALYGDLTPMAVAAGADVARADGPAAGGAEPWPEAAD